MEQDRCPTSKVEALIRNLRYPITMFVIAVLAVIRVEKAFRYLLRFVEREAVTVVLAVGVTCKRSSKTGALADGS